MKEVICTGVEEKQMKIKSTEKGTAITNIDEWKDCFVGTKKKKERDVQWKSGRSAKTLAEYVLRADSPEQGLEDVLNKTFCSIPELKNDCVFFDIAYPEFSVSFDRYPSPREHDLGVFGKTRTGKELFVGLEAKVDEKFGNTVMEEYEKAIEKRDNGVKTNLPERIMGLLNYLHLPQSIDKFPKLRYQLLHGLVGTVKNLDVAFTEPDYPLFCVLVFKTKGFSEKDDYKEIEGKANYQDYEYFIRVLRENGIAVNEYQCNEAFVKGNIVYEIKLPDGKKVYTAYVEIEAENQNNKTVFHIE